MQIALAKLSSELETTKLKYPQKYLLLLKRLNQLIEEISTEIEQMIKK